MKFEIKFVNSTAIRLIAYSENTLRVIFCSGSVYDYNNVDRQTFDNICNAKSVGTEFQKIRTRYTYQRLSPNHAAVFMSAVLTQVQTEKLIVEV